MKLLQDADLKNKRVFLRVDFNVPLKNGEITDNNRIMAILPTVKYLVENQAKVIIGTHCGRPDGKKSAETSIAPMARELQRLANLKITMAPDVLGLHVREMVALMKTGDILVLENLRWDSREEADDSEFAKELAHYADLYVNDAFAVSHRANASVHAICQFLPGYAGLLMQKEVENLSSVVANPLHPFVLVIGGVKVKDKAGMIDKLGPIADKILVGGGVANTFLKARGHDIGASVYDKEMVDACKDMLITYSDKIVIPTDYETENSDEGFMIYDLGPNTRHDYYDILSKSAMSLWNGNLGYTEEPKFCEGSRTVAFAMRDSGGKTILAGGDTAGFVINEGLANQMSFVSTGGGAALEFLAGERLPGIQAIS
jgi:phosphoglycerate kinase